MLARFPEIAVYTGECYKERKVVMKIVKMIQTRLKNQRRLLRRAKIQSEIQRSRH